MGDGAGVVKTVTGHLLPAGLVWLLAGWAAMTLVSDPHARHEARLLAQGAASIGFGLLLFPGWRDPTPVGALSLAGWSILLAAGSLVQAGLQGAVSAMPGQWALAVFLLALFAHAAVYALIPATGDAGMGPCLAFGLYALLLAIPVWLGPWMEPLQDRCPLCFQAILWLCPLTYLADMLGYDFLREQWFYQHTPFGMLRYEYPDGAALSLGLAGVSAWLLFLGRRVAPVWHTLSLNTFQIRNKREKQA